MGSQCSSAARAAALSRCTRESRRTHARPPTPTGRRAPASDQWYGQGYCSWPSNSLTLRLATSLRQTMADLDIHNTVSHATELIEEVPKFLLNGSGRVLACWNPISR